MTGFDEFLLGYKDRRAVLPASHREKVAPGRNGMSRPMLIELGEVSGIWSRTVRARGGELELEFFARSRRRSKSSLDASCERYAQFLGMPLLKRTLA